MKREFRPGTTIIHAETANRPEVRPGGRADTSARLASCHLALQAVIALFRHLFMRDIFCCSVILGKY